MQQEVDQTLLVPTTPSGYVSHTLQSTEVFPSGQVSGAAKQAVTGC